MNEDRIDEWLRKFQHEHKELVHIGVDELRDLAYALHNDIPLGYEASMRLGNWLLNATLGGDEQAARTLTADDVLNAVYKHGARWQAIADELNATMDVGECEIETTESWLLAERYHRCKICGAFFAVNACPNCGKW